MIFKTQKNIGDNGARLLVKCTVRTTSSCSSVSIQDVKKEDVEILLAELKEQIMKRFIK